MILGLDAVVVVVLTLTSGYSGSEDQLVLVGLGDSFGLLAAAFLYLTLLISPLALTFPKLPHKQTWFLARRGLGLSSLVFALPHALVSFFGPLGGIAGIPFLDPYSGWALVLGLVALVVLVLLGSTAWDGAVRRLGQPRWKLLHRTVYLAGVLVLVHLVLIGTHYGDPHSPWTFWSLVAVGFLVFLEALRFDQWWAKRFPRDRRFGPASLLAVVLITSAWFWTSSHSETVSPGSGVRWVIGHHGMVLPAPVETLEAKP
jgi:DMSO/TMAO reductase YedYZ heme-binding membrane subunit